MHVCENTDIETHVPSLHSTLVASLLQKAQGCLQPIPPQRTVTSKLVRVLFTTMDSGPFPYREFLLGVWGVTLRGD